MSFLGLLHFYWQSLLESLLQKVLTLLISALPTVSDPVSETTANLTEMSCALSIFSINPRLLWILLTQQCIAFLPDGLKIFHPAIVTGFVSVQVKLLEVNGRSA